VLIFHILRLLEMSRDSSNRNNQGSNNHRDSSDAFPTSSNRSRRTNPHPPTVQQSSPKIMRNGGSPNGKQSHKTRNSPSIHAEIEKEESMIYLEGPQIYTCAQCRTHLTSHDDIISKSFHGRHGRAYLFDECINVTQGPTEDRLLITGMHSVSDIFCNRCKTLVGWTYSKAYEPSQKYKEGKFIIEKIHLHLEETLYGIQPPAGERGDKWRVRSMSWGSGADHARSNTDDRSSNTDIVYEYRLASAAAAGGTRGRSATVALGNTVAFATGNGITSRENTNASSLRINNSRSEVSKQGKSET